MKLNIAICTLAIGVMLTACKTPQLGYFQDLQDGDKKELTEENIIKLQSGDRLSILVSSKDPNLAYLYNLQVVGHYRSTSSSNNLQTSSIASYTVDEKGDIDFPYLGKLHGASGVRGKNFIKIPFIMITYSFGNSIYGHGCGLQKLFCFFKTNRLNITGIRHAGFIFYQSIKIILLKMELHDEILN